MGADIHLGAGVGYGLAQVEELSLVDIEAPDDEAPRERADVVLAFEVYVQLAEGIHLPAYRALRGLIGVTLLSCVLRLFLRMVTDWYERAAKQAGLAGAKTGAIAFPQRFGDSLNLNVHFHVAFLDGPGSAGGQ